MITTCPICGKLYEEASDKEANNRHRSCLRCWYDEDDDGAMIEPYQYYGSMKAPIYNG